MNQRFADSFYFIALLNPLDQYHQVAVEATQRLDCRILSTSWVLVEVADALSTPALRSQVLRFLDAAWNDPTIAIVPPDKSWLERGIDLYRRRPDKSWSLTDCISFVVMAESGITEALTGDHHFEQAGFACLLK